MKESSTKEIKKSSPTKVSQPRLSTKSGRTSKGRFVSGTQPANTLRLESLRLRAAALELPELIIKPETARKLGGGYFVVTTQCVHCGKTMEKDLRNLEKGFSTKCRCAVKYKDPRALTVGRRYEAMIQRCYRDTHVSSYNYKGRGIKVRFQSREEFIRWALAAWPACTFKGWEFDRIDNEGHYEVSNLRLASSSLNSFNTRRNQVIERVDAILKVNPDVKYAVNTVHNLIRKGLSDKEIVARYHRNKGCKARPPGKKQLKLPSQSTTFLMPDPAAASLVKGCWYQTATDQAPQP